MDPCPVLVGRQQELSVLRSLLEAGGGVAIVSGEAGIGKSRLVREFASEAVARGRIDLWARPEEVAQPGPYALIVDLLETLAERGSFAVNNEARDLVSELTRTEADGQRPAPSPRTVAAEIRGLVSHLGGSPLIVMEDLHWADEQSHSVVLHLMRAARDDKHVVVATTRPERGKSEESLAKLRDSLARERIATELALTPLDQAEMGEMLELIWKRPPSDAELSDLQRLGEGIPFFIEELASSLKETGSPGLPRSIEQSVAARLSELGEEAARVLRAASLTTGALDVAVLALACDVPERRVTDHLIAASRAGLLADTEGRLVFRHSLAREAIRVGLVSVESARLHGHIATAIEKVHSGELDPFASALAHHYREAGERAPAIEYSIRSGYRSLAFAATDDARAAFRSALELDRDSVSGLRGLAEVEFRDAHETEAAELFRRAANVQVESGSNVDAARTLGRLSWALQGQVEPSEVIAVLDEALGLISDDGHPQERARLMVQKGSIQCFLQNETAEARPTLTNALDMAERAGDALLVAEALDGLAQADELDGDLARALSLSAKAIEAANRSADAEIQGRTHNNHALKLAVAGRPDEALVALSEGRRYLSAAYGRAAVAALDVSQAWVSWLMGLPAEVARLTARGRVAWQRWRGYAWLLETWSAIEQGERARAEAALDSAWTALGGQQALHKILRSESSVSTDASSALFAEVLFALSVGDQGRAVNAADVLVQYGLRKADRFDLGLMLLIQSRTLTSHDLGLARNALSSLDDLLRSFNYPYLQAGSHEISALIDGKQGDHAKAAEHLRAAIDIHARCSNLGDSARCERLLATSISTLTGDRSEVRSLLKVARAKAESAGAVLEVTHIDALGRDMGLHLRSGRTRRVSSESGGLSPREYEVAALVAEGETNAGIANRLYLSERTVQDHITHALRKLQLPSRAALASWAARNGLL